MSGHEASAQGHMMVVFLGKGLVKLARAVKRIDQRMNW